MNQQLDVPQPLTPDDLAELQSAIAQVDAMASRAPSASGDDVSISRLLWRKGHIKIQMDSELAGHNRPHFHIAFKRQYAASYAVDTLERLCGFLPRRYEETALQWARHHQTALQDIWNSLSAGKPLWTLELPNDER